MQKVKTTILAVVIGLIVAVWVAPVMAVDTKVNINTATKEVLVTLKHVGEEYARRIIAYRDNEKFSSPEDIMNVKGIGKKIYEANKDLIIVTD